MTECTCGHDELADHFHMTPCPIKVEHLRIIHQHREASFVRETFEHAARLFDGPALDAAGGAA